MMCPLYSLKLARLGVATPDAYRIELAIVRRLLVHSSLQMRAFCANESSVSCSIQMNGCEYKQDRMN
jgi:hypothetical protein